MTYLTCIEPLYPLKGEPVAKSSDKPGKIGLYVFGLGEIFVGLLYALISLVMLAIPKLPSPNPQLPMPQMWPIALMGVTFSSFVIALGVGTFMAKRWARKIMLILSWYGLGAGLITILFLVFFMGSFLDTAFSSAPNITPAAIRGIKIGMMVAMGVFYIILPGIFILFYQSKYVLSAVEYYDPQENWMDACPTPVFAVSFFSVFGAIAMGIFGLMMLGTDSPSFAMVVPVWAIALFLALMFGALTYIAIGFYQLDMKAWWAALFLVVFGCVATFFIFKIMDPLSLYEQMKVPQAQIDQIKKTGMLDMFKSMSNGGWLMMLPYLAYLGFVRKYFLRDGSKKSR